MKNVWFGVAALWLIAAVIVVQANEPLAEFFCKVTYTVPTEADAGTRLVINDSTSNYTNVVKLDKFRVWQFAFRYYAPEGANAAGLGVLDSTRIMPIMQTSWDKKKWTDYNAAGAAMDSAGTLSYLVDSLKARTLAQNPIRDTLNLGPYVRFKLWVRDTIVAADHTAINGKTYYRAFSAYVRDVMH